MADELICGCLFVGQQEAVQSQIGHSRAGNTSVLFHLAGPVSVMRVRILCFLFSMLVITFEPFIPPPLLFQ